MLTARRLPLQKQDRVTPWCDTRRRAATLHDSPTSTSRGKTTKVKALDVELSEARKHSRPTCESTPESASRRSAPGLGRATSIGRGPGPDPACGSPKSTRIIQFVPYPATSAPFHVRTSRSGSVPSLRRRRNRRRELTLSFLMVASLVSVPKANRGALMKQLVYPRKDSISTTCVRAGTANCAHRSKVSRALKLLDTDHPR